MQSFQIACTAFAVSIVFIGCFSHVEPLRKFESLSITPNPIKIIYDVGKDNTAEALSLNDVVSICMKRNHALQIARQDIAIAEGQLRQAKSFSNPEIEFGISASSAADSVLSITGSLLQPISLFLPKRRVAIEVAEASLDRAKAEIQRFEWALIVEVKRAYFQVLLLENEKVLFAQSVEDSEKLFEATHRLKKGGEVSRISELLVQSDVVEAKARLIEIESLLTKKRSELTELIGMNSLPVLMDGKLEFPESVDIKNVKLEQLFAANNPELYLRDAEVRLSKLEQVSASNAWWPGAKVGVQVERDTEGDRLFGGLFSMDLPIFNRNQGEIQSRNAQLSKVQIERSQTDFIGRLALDRLTILLEQALRLISLYRNEGLPSSEENTLLVRRAIEAGETSTIELITANRRAISAKLEYLRAKFSGVEILIDMEAVLGTRVFDLDVGPVAP
ncbi:MAG: TolC family protein [Desulfobacteraceae bacterium]|jgi:cobalt-zinc-cadmium efflux system outer membrane protein